MDNMTDNVRNNGEDEEREIARRENATAKAKEPKLRRFMDAFGNVFALNICFVVGCIPVVTIGASLTALYAMCIRLQEGEEETIVAGFIHEFKRSFKQSTIAYLLALLALFIMYAEFMVVKTVSGFWSTFYTGVLITECIFVALTVPFLFPLIARYDNKLSVLARNAIVLSVTYFWSWVKFVVAWFAPIAICIIYPVIFASIWYLWLILLFGLIAWGTTHTMRKVFRQNDQRVVDAKRKAEEAARKAEEEAREAEEEARELKKEETGKLEKNEAGEPEEN